MLGYFKISSCVFILCFANPLISQTKFSRTYGAYGAFNQGISMVQHPENGFLLGCSTGGWDTQNGDILLIRIDSLGNEIWKKTFIYPQTEQLNALIIKQNGEYLICGQSNSFGNGDWDGFILCIDDDGNNLGIITLPLDGWQTFHQIVEHPDGKLFAVGQSFTAGVGEMWMACFDESNNLLFESKILGGQESSATGISISNNGNLMLSGWAINQITGNKEALIVEVNVEGMVQNSMTFPLNTISWAEDIVSTPDNRFMIAANTTLADGRNQPYFLLINESGGIVQSFYNPGNDNWQIKNVSRRADGLFIFGFEFEFNRPVGGFIVFDEAFNFICNGYVPDGGIGSSNIGMAIPAGDSWAFVATIEFASPGNTSVFCVVTDETCDVGQSILVKTDEVNPNRMVTLRPNPSSDGMLFVDGLACANLLWQVKSLDGRSVASGKTMALSSIALPETLQNGYYILELENCLATEKMNHRFLLQR